MVLKSLRRVWLSLNLLSISHEVQYHLGGQKHPRMSWKITIPHQRPCYTSGVNIKLLLGTHLQNSHHLVFYGVPNTLGMALPIRCKSPSRKYGSRLIQATCALLLGTRACTHSQGGSCLCADNQRGCDGEGRVPWRGQSHRSQASDIWFLASRVSRDLGDVGNRLVDLEGKRHKGLEYFIEKLPRMLPTTLPVNEGESLGLEIFFWKWNCNTGNKSAVKSYSPDQAGIPAAVLAVHRVPCLAMPNACPYPKTDLALKPTLQQPRLRFARPTELFNQLTLLLRHGGHRRMSPFLWAWICG